MFTKKLLVFLPVLVFALTIVLTPPARAHCDALDGPVVTTARRALAGGDVYPVLKWVSPSDEEEVIATFEKTMVVRTLSQEAAELADEHFFETVVRLHRAGEGAPYSGLKPAGQVSPVIEMADRAAEDGAAEELADAVLGHARSGIGERLERLVAARERAGDSVAEGRKYVAAYVEFVHYVEQLHDAAAGHGSH